MKNLEILKNKLRYLNYSEKTIETYLCYLSKFFEEENITDPYQVTTVRIVYYLENKRFTSISQQNQIIGALKLFARLILNKKDIHYILLFLSKIIRILFMQNRSVLVVQNGF